jgi:hypothetical protein
MSKGYVYSLKNSAMPGLRKIGKTSQSIEMRVKQLSDATGVPAPFEVDEYVYLPDCDLGEAWVHEQLARYRVNPRREFFRAPEDKISNALTSALNEQMSIIVDEFMPDHALVELDLVIDPPDILILADGLNAEVQDIVAAFPMMSADEFRPVYERYRSRVEERRRALELGLPLPPFVRKK